QVAPLEFGQIDGRLDFDRLLIGSRLMTSGHRRDDQQRGQETTPIRISYLDTLHDGSLPSYGVFCCWMWSEGWSCARGALPESSPSRWPFFGACPSLTDSFPG